MKDNKICNIDVTYIDKLGDQRTYITTGIIIDFAGDVNFQIMERLKMIGWQNLGNDYQVKRFKIAYTKDITTNGANND